MDLSYSTLSKMARCPLEWWFHKVVRVRPVEALSPKMLLGSAFHASVEWAHRRAAATGSLPEFSAPEALAVGVDYIHTHLTPDLQAAWIEEWGHDPTDGSQLCVMLEMMDLRTRSLLGGVQTEILGVEQEVNAELDGQTVTGRIDLLYLMGGNLVVRDYKTSSRLDTLFAVLSPQLLVYAWLLQKLGRLPLWVEVVTVSSVPAVAPKLTKPTKKFPEGRLAATPNRYTPSMYRTFCETNGIEPDPDEFARLTSDAHVAKFVTVSRRLVSPQAIEGVESWLRWYAHLGEDIIASRRRPEGCRDPRRCSSCDYKDLCRDLEDTGTLGPASSYGMRRVEER